MASGSVAFNKSSSEKLFETGLTVAILRGDGLSVKVWENDLLLSMSIKILLNSSSKWNKDQLVQSKLFYRCNGPTPPTPGVYIG